MGITLARLRGLSPLGPIFGKELRSTARRRRTYVLRFVYLALLFVIMLFFFGVTTLNLRGQNYSAVRQSQRLAEMGATFFGIFSFFTLCSMALVGPVLTATAVNAERLHKTLPVLLMTPITAWQIVSGKLFSRLLIAFTLIGLTLPALSVVRLLGGVETDQIIASLGLSISTVIFAAAIGLLLSTLMNRAYSVILLSYGALMILYALLPAAIGILIETMARAGAAGPRGMPPGVWFFYHFVSFTNPFFMMAVQVLPGAPIKASMWVYCASFHLIAAALLLVLSGLVLRRMAKKENDGGGAQLPPASMPPDSATATPLEQRRHQHQQDIEAWRRRTSNISDNPVLWREIRRPLVAKRWQAVAMSVLFVGILIFFYVCMAINNALNDRDLQMPFACIFCGLLTLLACVVSATAIAQEKESDTWTLLLSSPLSARQIVLGKLAGLLRRLMWPSILITVHFLLFALGGVINWTTAWVILFLIFSTNIIWVATGLYYSLRLKTVTFAVILNLCGPVALYGLAAILLGIAGAFFYRSDKGFEFVGLYSPYAHMCSAISDLNERHPNYNYYTAQVLGDANFLNRKVWVPLCGQIPATDFLMLVFSLGFAYLLLTAGIVWYTTHAFNKLVGRADQIDRQSGQIDTPRPVNLLPSP